MAWTDRLGNVFRRHALDAAIDEELQFHVDERTRENVAAGLTPEDALADAQRRFGGLLRARERTHDANISVWLETIGHDVRYAFRTLRRSPFVTSIIVASLALAIGATTTMFSIVNAVLLRSFPYSDSDRLVMLWTANLLNGSMTQNTSVPNIDDWKAQSHTLEDLAAYREAKGALIDATHAAGNPRWVRYEWVTNNFFAVLGRSAAAGRVFTSEEFASGARVAVVSHSLWQRQFGSWRDAIGKPVRIGGIDAEIIGVMPDDFWFPSKDVDVWMPATAGLFWQRNHADRGTRFGVVFGRLKGGVSVEQARADMHVIADRLRHAYPSANGNLDINLVPLQEQILGQTVRFILLMLFASVACVLMIASANVANLLLARGVARHREIAVRAALGAGRGRIARQLITESVILACAAGGAGLMTASWIMPALVSVAPADIPRIDEARLDGTVLLFTLAVSVATGVMFGLAPALRSLRSGGADLAHAIHRVSGAQASLKLRGAFVIGQFALAVVLLAVAGLLVRSLLAVQSVSSGFGNTGAITAQLRFDPSVSATRRAQLYAQAIDRIRALPGVKATGAIGTMFWSESGKFGLRAIDGHPDKPRDQWEPLTWTTVSGDYFNAVGVPLLRGRLFADTDRHDSRPVALINRTMAHRYWPGENPVGHRIKGFDARGANDDWVTVVGVVEDVRSEGPERAPIAQVFETQSQSLDETENLTVLATTPTVSDTIRRAVREVDATAVLSDVSTLDERLSALTSQRRFQTYLLCAFAILAVVLAGAGIFGTMHYWVAQRTSEIGIRMALGARPRSVVTMVLGQAMMLLAVGGGLGVAGAFMTARVMSSLLFGVTPHDPTTFGIVLTGLAALALVACYVPARRAASVDPLSVLKAD